MMIIGLTISHKSKMNRNFTLKKVKKMYQTLYVIVLTFAKVSRGLRSVNLFLLRLLTCSTTREKWDMALRPSLACNESSTSQEDKLEKLLYNSHNKMSKFYFTKFKGFKYDKCELQQLPESFIIKEFRQLLAVSLLGQYRCRNWVIGGFSRP